MTTMIMRSCLNATQMQGFAPRPVLPRRRGQCTTKAVDKEKDARTGVFQLHPVQRVSMHVVRDAVEACSCAHTATERDQCYASFGLDGRKVEAYYLPVVAMESGLQAVGGWTAAWPSVDEETGLRLARAGSLLLTLLVASRFAT